MNLRCGKHVLIGLLGFATCVGCQIPQLDKMGAGFAGEFSTATAAKGRDDSHGHDLPADKAAETCFSVGCMQEKNGYMAEAAGQYELARRYNPNLPGVARRLAVVYDNLGNYSQALTEYENALAATPRDPDLLNDLGYHYYTCGKWADAEKALRQALEINPRHAAAWINLGMTLAQQGQYPESVEAFGQAGRPAEASCNLGFILMAQGKREEARQAYRQALALEPELRLAQAAIETLDHPERARLSKEKENAVRNARRSTLMGSDIPRREQQPAAAPARPDVPAPREVPQP
jgi:Tfp pilus assembly protein PilF